MIVKCPICKRPVPWSDNELFKPFCSERCKLIDLGEWATEDKRIPWESLPFDLLDDEIRGSTNLKTR